MQSLTNGHNVPTGFTSERRLWLDVVVRNNAGTVLFSSGRTALMVICMTVTLGKWLQIRKLDEQYGQSTVEKIKCGLVSWNYPTPQAVFPMDADYIEKHSLRPLKLRGLL